MSKQEKSGFQIYQKALYPRNKPMISTAQEAPPLPYDTTGWGHDDHARAYHQHKQNWQTLMNPMARPENMHPAQAEQLAGQASQAMEHHKSEFQRLNPTGEHVESPSVQNRSTFQSNYAAPPAVSAPATPAMTGTSPSAYPVQPQRPATQRLTSYNRE